MEPVADIAECADSEAFDEGPPSRKATTHRMCAVTRERLVTDLLLRFVRGPDGTVVPDFALRLPGRGAWLKLDSGVVGLAAKKNVFARAFKASASVRSTLVADVENGLRKRALNALSLARKSSAVTAGLSKVEAALEKPDVIALIAASDAADDGRLRLEKRYFRICEANNRTPRIVNVFERHDLGLALGRSDVVHAALRATGAALHFLTETQRLELYLAGSAPTAKT